MRKDDIFPSKYISAADLGKREFTLVIASAEMEMIGGEGEKEKKLVLHFQGADKGLVCNSTNFDMIAFMHGDDTDDWVGKEIVLHAMPVNFRGKTVMGVRVKAPVQGNGGQLKVQDRGTHKLSTMVPVELGDDEIPF